MQQRIILNEKEKEIKWNHNKSSIHLKTVKKEEIKETKIEQIKSKSQNDRFKWNHVNDHILYK